jgi:uncharacterized hydrophobic protein (TIGR00271 family)
MEETENKATADNGKAPEKKFDQRILRLLAMVRDFARTTMNLDDDSDQQGTIDTIKKDMVFRGHVVWILICSIFIASIGLNLNSAAVIIGAMLISPLMGPILAVGLSVGTNDWETLKRALKNFGVMVVVALTTSTFYFFITPLHEAQSELLARTTPTFLDALIAIFGGLAGIIGVSRRNRGNVIPGVAIATALMPPLCTAGYGIANGQWSFFFGAFYLFSLNSIFIAGATLVIVRYLRFPLVSFVDPLTEKRVKRYMLTFVIVVLLPSAWIFYGIVKETIFLGKAERFISENLQFEGTEIISKKIAYTDSISRIDVFIMGEPISNEAQEQLERTMLQSGLQHTVLKIHQPNDVSTDFAGKLGNEVRVGILEDLYRRNDKLLAEKDSEIERLRTELNSFEMQQVPIAGITSEMKILYTGIDRVSYAASVEARGNTVDTIPTFMVGWKANVPAATRQSDTRSMEKWLKQRLVLDTVRIVGF